MSIFLLAFKRLIIGITGIKNAWSRGKVCYPQFTGLCVINTALLKVININSEYLIIDEKGWRLKENAPDDLKKDFKKYMKEVNHEN